MVRHGGYEAQMTFKAWYFKHLLQTKSFPLKLPYGLLILKHEKTMQCSTHQTWMSVSVFKSE